MRPFPGIMGLVRALVYLIPGIAGTGLLALCLSTLAAASVRAHATGVPYSPRLTRALFLDGPRAPQAGRFPTPSLDLTVRRSRSAYVDWRLLGQWEDGSVTRLRLNLFGDVDYRTALVRVVRRGPKSVSYTGRIDGEPDSVVQAVVQNDVLAAVIQIPRRGLFYRVDYAGKGVHRIVEENHEAIPECATGSGEHIKLPKQPGYDISPDNSPLIDLLVLYTGVARAAAGGTDAMESQVQLAVDAANTAYANSNIAARVRLVHTEEVAYDETGTFSDHLNRLTDTTDGVMDNVAALRAQYRADMVALIVEDQDSCGIGWVMDTASPQFAPYADCVVNRGCSAGYWSLAHEMGHNMGCFHDRDNSASTDTPIQAWAYGWRFTGDDGVQYRTVMSYAPGQRIPFFSNPDVQYKRMPTGVPHGQPNASDNAAVINSTTPMIAAFQASLPAPVTRTDALRALSIAGGLTEAKPGDQLRLNVEDTTAAILDMADALRLARQSAGTD